MKKWISVVLAVFMTCAVFAQKWPMSLDEMKYEVLIHGVEDTDDHLLTYKQLEWDEDLYNFMVGIWYTYFEEYAIQWGIPFICFYQSVPNSHRYGGQAVKCDGYNVIMISDQGPRRNWATYFKENLSVKDKDNLELACHELVHIIQYVYNEDHSVIDSHESKIWHRESARLAYDYGLDIN